METENLFSTLVLVAFTGGVIYLTLADWRDRRRQDNEKQQQKRR
jgi:hypothetical protein